jgi:hypothetical protein
LSRENRSLVAEGPVKKTLTAAGFTCAATWDFPA